MCALIAPGSGSFHGPTDANQNDRSDKGDDDGGEDPSAGPQTKQPKDPTAHDAAEHAEDDVDQDAVATALHDLACQPPGNQSHEDPVDEQGHGVLLVIGCSSSELAKYAGIGLSATDSGSAVLKRILKVVKIRRST